MSVQVNGINVIDDDRNFSAAGIVTVGTGNSATIIDGTTGITSVGIGVTIDGIAGNISIAGTLTAAGFNTPASLVSLVPPDGATDVSTSAKIYIIFDRPIGTGTTGFIYLREGSAGGTTIETFGVDDVTLTNGNTTLNITQTSVGYSTDVYTVMEEGFIQSTSGDFIGLNTTGADSYSFTTEDPPLGQFYEGGYLICAASSLEWIVAPASAEISSNWYNRNNAVTCAQSILGCTGWFVPSIGQLQNPGYTCRTYWDSYSSSCYWSNTQKAGANHAGCVVNFTNGNVSTLGNLNGACIRAFRCVTY